MTGLPNLTDGAASTGWRVNNVTISQAWALRRVLMLAQYCGRDLAQLACIGCVHLAPGTPCWRLYFMLAYSRSRFVDPSFRQNVPPGKSGGSNPPWRLVIAALSSLLAHVVIATLAVWLFAGPRGLPAAIRNVLVVRLPPRVDLPSPSHHTTLLQTVVTSRPSTPLQRKPFRRDATARTASAHASSVDLSSDTAYIQSAALNAGGASAGTPSAGGYVVDYNLISSNRELAGGRATYSWHSEEQRYSSSLTSFSPAGGLGALHIQSSGRIENESPRLESAQFGAPGRILAEVTARATASDAMDFARTGDAPERKMISAGVFDPLSLARAVISLSPADVGTPFFVVDQDGVRSLTLTEIADERLNLAELPMQTRRFTFTGEGGQNALTIWVAPDYGWAPARLRLPIDGTMLTFEATSIRQAWTLDTGTVPSLR